MEDPMKRSYSLFLIFSALLGALATADAATTVTFPKGITCAKARIASFGWTDKRLALAEFAAIRKWQLEAELKNPGFSNWHMSNKRTMKCQLYKESNHIQCQVSARPCRLDKS